MNKSDMILKKAELFERFSLFGRRSDFLKKIGQDVNNANTQLTPDEIIEIQNNITNIHNKDQQKAKEIDANIAKLKSGQTGSWVGVVGQKGNDIDGIFGPRTIAALSATHPNNRNYRNILNDFRIKTKTLTQPEQDVFTQLKELQEKTTNAYKILTNKNYDKSERDRSAKELESAIPLLMKALGQVAQLHKNTPTEENKQNYQLIYNQITTISQAIKNFKQESALDTRI
jgi:hypothetical protein